MSSFCLFAALDRPNLEDKHRHRVQAALAYARELENFDNLVDPRHFFDCYLGPEPSKYVLEKFAERKRVRLSVHKFLSFVYSQPNLLTCFSLFLAKMATR